MDVYVYRLGVSLCLSSANEQEVFFFTQLVYKGTCSDTVKILLR